MFAILKCLPPCRGFKDRVASGLGQGKLIIIMNDTKPQDPAIATNPWVGKVFAILIAGIFLMVGFGLWAIYTYQSKVPKTEPAPLAPPQEPGFG